MDPTLLIAFIGGVGTIATAVGGVAVAFMRKQMARVRAEADARIAAMRLEVERHKAELAARSKEGEDTGRHLLDRADDDRVLVTQIHGWYKETRELLLLQQERNVKLLERIVRVHSSPGDHLLDFFAGSGTFGEAALRHGRHVTLVDREAAAIAVMRQRLAPWAPTVEVLA